MLVPKPKKAFQSPGVHSVGLLRSVMSSLVRFASSNWLTAVAAQPADPRRVGDPAEDPALRLDHRRPTSWNSGKYEPQQSPGTMQR